MSEPPIQGNFVFGPNPLDPLHKSSRPASVVRVVAGDDPVLTVIFGQSFDTGAVLRVLEVSSS